MGKEDIMRYEQRAFYAAEAVRVMMRRKRSTVLLRFRNFGTLLPNGLSKTTDIKNLNNGNGEIRKPNGQMDFVT